MKQSAPLHEFDQAVPDTGGYWVLAKPGTQTCVMNVSTDPPMIITFDDADLACRFAIKYDVPAAFEPRYIPPKTVN